MKCDELKPVFVDMSGNIVANELGELYYKPEVDAAIAELKETLDKYVIAKLSAQQVLQDLFDCGLIKEWYFNGKFNAIMKADDPHLEIAKLKAENAQLMKETEFMRSNCKWDAGDGCSRLLGEKLAIIDENVKLKQKLEDAKATHYAEMVDANMENRKLKRALWIARAKRAIEKIAWFKLWNSSISTMNPEDGARQEFDKWKKALGKFLKKAEEYK